MARNKKNKNKKNKKKVVVLNLIMNSLRGVCALFMLSSGAGKEVGSAPFVYKETHCPDSVEVFFRDELDAFKARQEIMNTAMPVQLFWVSADGRETYLRDLEPFEGVKLDTWGCGLFVL